MLVESTGNPGSWPHSCQPCRHRVPRGADPSRRPPHTHTFPSPGGCCSDPSLTPDKRWGLGQLHFPILSFLLTFFGVPFDEGFQLFLNHLIFFFFPESERKQEL